MLKRFLCLIVLTMGLVVAASPVVLCAEELVVRPCADLIRLANSYRDDLKTVDTMLGVAIEAGDLDKIKAYKLKKSAVQKQLDAVLKAIEIKECAKTN